MNLSRFETMDPRLLPGLVNTALRNDCEGLDDLIATHGLDRDRFLARLSFLGYQYESSSRQFRPVDSRPETGSPG